MRTTRPISTISYNSDHFLISGLTDLLISRKISFWAFINHLPDNDDGKAHKHLFIVPDERIDTSVISEKFEEFSDDNILPLKWMPCRFSNFDNWALYSVHDKDYLKFKGKERKYFYKWDEFITSNDTYFNLLVHDIDISPYSGYSSLIDAYYRGENFAQLIVDGKVPLNRVVQYSTIWKALQEGHIKEHDKFLQDINNFKEV